MSKAQISVFTSHNCEMHKHYPIDDNGNPKKGNPIADMYKGEVETIPANTPQDLQKILKNLQGNQAISTFINLTDKTQITVKGKETETATSRSKGNFGTSKGEQIVCLDYDDVFDFTPRKISEFLNELFNTPRMLTTVGGSALVVRDDSELTPDDLADTPTSTHAYLWLDSGDKLENFIEFLNYQCAVRGLIKPKIACNGNVRIEHLFDNAPLKNQCTLIFEAKPTADVGLKVLDKYFNAQDGKPLDLDFKLTEAQIKEYKDICRNLVKSVEIEAATIHASWAKAKGKELKAKGFNKSRVDAVIKGRTTAHGEHNNLYFLSIDDEIKTKDGFFKVSEIIADKARFHKMECVDIDDVDDPKDCDRYRAIIRFDTDESVTLFSRASGDKMYILKRRKAQMPANVVPHEPPEAIPDFEELAPDKKFTDRGVTLKPTISNLKLLLECYGIRLTSDEISRKNIIHYPNAPERGNETNNADVLKLMDLCNKNDLNENVVNKRGVIFDQNRINPVVDMFKSKEWDGYDHFSDLVQTVTLAYEIDKSYFTSIFRMWLLQCVAAADYIEHSPLTAKGVALPKFENVLVFTGTQGGHKTEWFMSLLPKELKGYGAKGVILRIDDKDSIFQATSYWIVEWGELGATFKRSDIDQIKGFLSHSYDVMRRPYAIETCEYKRRTSFCATVNDTRFLHDTTGNRRFLPVEVIKCDWNHSVDMQQVWAQMWHEYLNGARWWLVDGDSVLSEVLEHQRGAMDYDPIVEKFLKVFGEPDNSKEPNCSMSLSEILFEILPVVKIDGVKKLEREPSKIERSKLRGFLKERGVKEISVKGNYKYKFFNKLLPPVRKLTDDETNEIAEMWGG